MFTFNPENTVEPSLIKELASYVETAGGAIHYVELICSDTEIIKRIGHQSRRKFGKLTDASIYMKLKKAGGFDFPPFPTPLISVDTGVTAAEVSAAKIIAALTK